MRSYALYSIAGAFVLGVVARSVFPINLFFILFVILVALGGVTIVYIEKRRLFVLGILLPLFFTLGIVRFSVAESYIGDETLNIHVGEKVVLKGIVTKEPDVRENAVLLTVSIDTLGENTSINAKMLVITDRFKEVLYGDRIIVSGNLKRPENFTTSGGRLFDYEAYLRKDGIAYTILFPETEIVSHGKGNRVKSELLSIKGKFLEVIKRELPSPHSPLLGGILLGTKHALGDTLSDAFRRTGIIHIVVLSGYNVTIVAEAITKSLSFLPRFFSVSLGSGAIILFAIMTGASATTVRASIMALLVILSRVIERTYLVGRALIIAALLMVLHNPYIVLFDPSFQLSFLATVGLIYVAPLLVRFARWVPEKFELRTIVLATISTQLFVLPLLIYFSGEVSLVSLPVNILVLITIPPAMFFGFLAGTVGMISVLLAMPFTFITYTLLSYDLAVVSWFARLPFASISVPLIPAWLMLVSYGLLFLWLIMVWRKRVIKF